MREYDLISIGTGSAMNLIDPFLAKNPGAKVAIIDKDEPGGICLTKGCIPTKILVYPAELLRLIERAGEFGIEVQVRKVNFARVMERMRSHVKPEIEAIRKGLSNSKELDYYPAPAAFVAPYTLQVDGEQIRGKRIFLCAGSRPATPHIEGLEDVGYQTSDTIIDVDTLPESIAIIGAGYVAAEYGHFFSAMGSRTTIIGRNPQFLPDEEPEIAEVARQELGRHVNIVTGHEVRKVEKGPRGRKRIVAVDRKSGKEIDVEAQELLVATGRAPNTDLLRPERGGIKVDKNGWIVVNEYLETSQPNVWAFGDANGVYMFKHKANYETEVVYQNAILGKRAKVDYHAVPHAVFTHPEVAAVGLGEAEAIARRGEDGILIGFERYEDTAKGYAIGAKGYFAKVIVERKTGRILGAHIVGPHASVLIQEIVDVMNTPTQSMQPIVDAMHIHPALSEVVDRAFGSMMEPAHYHHELQHYFGGHKEG